MAIYTKLDMSKEKDKINDIDDIYQKAQAMVSVLGKQQREQAISYIKKIEQKKISELRQEVILES